MSWEQGVDTVGLQLEDQRSLEAFFPAAEKLAETVKLFGGDAVAAVGDIGNEIFIDEILQETMYNRDTGSAKNKTNEGIWGMEGNLTKGPIMKTLVKLAVPIMASAFLGTLYNITDMAWIGLLGSKAVAGVGVGGMFTWLSQGLASMARMGGQVQVAQCIGRGDREKAHGFAQAAVQLSAAMGIAYAVLCLIFVKQMVGFFRLEDVEAQAAALAYTKIACGLIVFSFLTLTLTGLYTAQGDSKTPFMANLIGLHDKHDPGSSPDPRTGAISETGCNWGGDRYGNGPGDRDEYHDSWDHCAEEGECVKRNPALCEDSG